MSTIKIRLALLAVFFLLLSHVAVAQTPETPNDPGLATDPGRLLYVRDGYFWLTDLLGNGVRRLIPAEKYATPVFSPDLKKVAYGKAGLLWVMNADETDDRQVSAVRVAGFSWSPLGDALCFSTFELGEKSDGGYQQMKSGLYVLHLKDGSTTLVHEPVEFGDCGAPRFRWSPDGRSISVSFPGIVNVIRDEAMVSTVYKFDFHGTGPRDTFWDTGCVKPLDPRWAYDSTSLLVPTYQRLEYRDRNMEFRNQLEVVKPDSKAETVHSSVTSSPVDFVPSPVDPRLLIVGPDLVLTDLNLKEKTLLVRDPLLSDATWVHDSTNYVVLKVRDGACRLLNLKSRATTEIACPA